MPKPAIAPQTRAEALRERLGALRAAGKVRLDDEEANALAEALAETIAGRGGGGSVALFGSRVSPASKGGDIDLLILADFPPFDTSQAIATRFFERCEERIDVVVIDPDTATPAQTDFLGRLQTVRIL
ncbi:MAG: nucleotidyltransferase domain-containing protein [Rhodocyclaceae bacterium]|nr:nucleotidyltransferase domain-containing protein [Rhodocyclaceae bacterium]